MNALPPVVAVRLPLAQFLKHLIWRIGFALALVAGSWAMGASAYHYLEPRLSWTDGFYNAAMILAGMGPVAELHSDAAKWFASLYALYSGVVFLAVASMVFAPFAHRLLHRFHVDK